MTIRRVIDKDDLSSFSLWDLPLFGENGEEFVEVKAKAAPMPTAEDLQKIQDQAYQEAYDEAFKKGHAEGFEKGQAEGHEQGYADGQEQGHKDAYEESRAAIQAQGERLRAVMTTLSEPLKELDHQVEEQIVALAMSVAKHIVRREIKTDPAQVIGTVKQAVAALPIAARNVQVMMHPEDARLVREALSVDESVGEEERRWRIVEDPTLTRGGCNIETENSRIDATVESRLAAVIAQVLGGDREGDG